MNLHDPHLERALVACAFHNAGVREWLLTEKLHPSLLSGKRERATLAACLRLHAEGSAVDTLTVQAAVDATAEVDFAFLVLLDVDLPDYREAGVFLRKLRDLATRRAVVDLASRARLRMGAADEEAATVLAELQGALRTVEDAHLRAPGEGEMASTYERAIELLDREPYQLLGIPTGFPDLDSVMMGLEPGRLIVPCGRPGSGKSVLLGNLARNAARRGHPVAIFTLEMSRLQLIQRMVADAACVPYSKVRRATLSDQERERAREWYVEMRDVWPLVIVERSSIPVADIAAACRRMKRERGLAMVAIDYLQLVTAPADNREQEVAAISRALKALAKDLEVPVVAAAQFNRNPGQRGDHRPRLEDLRESGQVEQDADVVIGIYREEVHAPRPDNRGDAEFLLLKNRDGELGTFRMRFDGEFQRFRCPSPVAAAPAFEQYGHKGAA